MATSRQFVCAHCATEKWAGGLFQTLQSCANGKTEICECGRTKDLQLIFPFGLDAEKYFCKVLAVFLPKGLPETWPNSDGGSVEFYPFLVIGRKINDESHRTIWLPYWHIIKYDSDRPTETKYGQWAPHLNLETFEDLVGQARQAGFLA